MTHIRSDQFAKLRPSTQFRIALAERDFARLHGSVPPPICGILPDDEAELKRRMVQMIEEDARAAVRRLRRLMKHEAFPELPPDAFKLHIDRTEPGFVATVTGRVGEPAWIELSLGSILAIEDALLGALCRATFLTNAGLETVELDEPIAFLRIPAAATRLRTYPLDQPGGLMSATLNPWIPRSAWRLYQFDVMAELSLQWIVLHEMAHWALGHIGFAAARTRAGDAALTLSEVTHSFALEGVEASGNCLTSSEHQTIEMQADFLASELLYFYHRAQIGSENTPLSRFGERMRELVDVRGTVLGDLDEAQQHRLLATAAGVVVLTIEARRQEVGTSRTHPLPETRAMQILTETFALANRSQSREGEDGGFILGTTDDDQIAEILETVRGQWRSLIIDMMGVSEALGTEPLFLRSEAPGVAATDPDMSSTSATFQDFLHLIFDAAGGEEGLATAGGREFWRLKQLDAGVRSACAAFAVWGRDDDPEAPSDEH